MMSSEFYSHIIEKEKKNFGITDERLKAAARIISSCYSKKSLKKGLPYPDFNSPEYRCAYLYKYANLHTGMITKYFRKFIKKSKIKNHFKKGIQICSLGGGPGIDIIGICKALAVIPYFQQRITKVSILDICGGWSNTFDSIISDLLTGKVKDVPETFLSSTKFKHELTEIDLLQPLSENVVETITRANVISMVKFVSVILARKGCLDALQVLGNLFKPGAFVFFIDNYQEEVFESVKEILNTTGLEIILGPLHEVYGKQTKHCNESTYGCSAQTAARISVVGFIKRDIKIIPQVFYSPSNVSYGGLETQYLTSTSDECNDEKTESSLNNQCHKFVQTEFEDCTNLFEDHIPQGLSHSDVEDLSELMKALGDLLEVIERVKKKNSCCHCH